MTTAGRAARGKAERRKRAVRTAARHASPVQPPGPVTRLGYNCHLKYPSDRLVVRKAGREA